MKKQIKLALLSVTLFSGALYADDAIVLPEASEAVSDLGEIVKNAPIVTEPVGNLPEAAQDIVAPVVTEGTPNVAVLDATGSADNKISKLDDAKQKLSDAYKTVKKFAVANQKAIAITAVVLGVCVIAYKIYQANAEKEEEAIF